MVRVCVVTALLIAPGLAAASPTQDRALIEQQQAIETAMAEAAAELLKPGPKREGWDKGGIDLDRLVEQAPGGSAGNYLLTIDKDGERTVSMVRARTLGAVPPQWAQLMEAGAIADLATSDGVSVGKLDGPHYSVSWEHSRRVGDAYCSTPKVGARLYRVPGPDAAGNIPPEVMPAMFNASMLMMTSRTVCWRFDRVANGFSTRYFLEDGRTLPMLDAYGEVTTIVPAGDLDALLGIKPKP